MLVEAL